MARSRNIKPSIMDNDQLAELDPLTRLLFIYMWMLADKAGRLEDRPKRIAAQALPFDRSCDVDAMLSSLDSAGFIRRYKAGGIACIQIVNFAKHQTPHVREAESSLPAQEQVRGQDAPKHNLGSAHAQPRQCKGDDETLPRSPDSLIPDSLIPEKNPPNPPPGGDGPASKTPKRERADRISLKTFIARCEANGQKPISDYRPVLEYVEATGIPLEFVGLAWDVFKAEHLPPGINAARLQADWRRHFLNYISKGYYRLWIGRPDGSFELTTAGLQAKAVQRARRRTEAETA